MSSYEEIIPRKKYRLYIELGIDGKGRRERRTRTVEASGPREAERLLRKFEAEVKETMHLEKENVTFASFADRWLKNFAEPSLNVSTVEKYESALKCINNHLGKRKVRDIQTFHIVQFFNEEKAAGRGSFDAKFKTLKSIFKYAVKWKVIARDMNPMDDVSKPKEQKMRAEKEQFYKASEIPALLAAFETLELHQQLICKLALFGGLRRGEIVGIALDAIDWEANQIHISRSLQITKRGGLLLKSTKTEEERTITLPKALMNELKAFNDHQQLIREEMGNLYQSFIDENGEMVDMLFANPDGKPYRPDAITRFWGRFMHRQQELRHVNFHGLRHSSASFLLSQGVNIKIIQIRLGHKDIKTTLNMYSHVTQEDDSAATQAFDKLF